MTELEIMERAKMYLDKLANGVNPLDDSRIPDYEVVSQARISRCLSYVSTVLAGVIEQEAGREKRRRRENRVPFHLLPEQRARFAYSEEPAPITRIAFHLCSLIDEETMRGVTPVQLTSGLVRMGMLQVVPVDEKRTRKEPTEQGKELGISTQVRSGPNGEYIAVLYDRRAQAYILEHLDLILEHESGEEHN